MRILLKPNFEPHWVNTQQIRRIPDQYKYNKQVIYLQMQQLATSMKT